MMKIAVRIQVLALVALAVFLLSAEAQNIRGGLLLDHQEDTLDKEAIDTRRLKKGNNNGKQQKQKEKALLRAAKNAKNERIEDIENILDSKPNKFDENGNLIAPNPNQNKNKNDQKKGADNNIDEYMNDNTNNNKQEHANDQQLDPLPNPVDGSPNTQGNKNKNVQNGQGLGGFDTNTNANNSNNQQESLPNPDNLNQNNNNKNNYNEEQDVLVTQGKNGGNANQNQPDSNQNMMGDNQNNNGGGSGPQAGDPEEWNGGNNNNQVVVNQPNPNQNMMGSDQNGGGNGAQAGDTGTNLGWNGGNTNQMAANQPEQGPMGNMGNDPNQTQNGGGNGAQAGDPSANEGWNGGPNNEMAANQPEQESLGNEGLLDLGGDEPPSCMLDGVEDGVIFCFQVGELQSEKCILIGSVPHLLQNGLGYSGPCIEPSASQTADPTIMQTDAPTSLPSKNLYQNQNNNGAQAGDANTNQGWNDSNANQLVTEEESLANNLNQNNMGLNQSNNNNGENGAQAGDTSTGQGWNGGNNNNQMAANQQEEGLLPSIGDNPNQNKKSKSQNNKGGNGAQTGDANYDRGWNGGSTNQMAADQQEEEPLLNMGNNPNQGINQGGDNGAQAGDTSNNEGWNANQMTANQPEEESLPNVGNNPNNQNKMGGNEKGGSNGAQAGDTTTNQGWNGGNNNNQVAAEEESLANNLNQNNIGINQNNNNGGNGAQAGDANTNQGWNDGNANQLVAEEESLANSPNQNNVGINQQNNDGGNGAQAGDASTNQGWNSGKNNNQMTANQPEEESLPNVGNNPNQNKMGGNQKGGSNGANAGDTNTNQEWNGGNTNQMAANQPEEEPLPNTGSNPNQGINQKGGGNGAQAGHSSTNMELNGKTGNQPQEQIPEAGGDNTKQSKEGINQNNNGGNVDQSGVDTTDNEMNVNVDQEPPNMPNNGDQMPQDTSPMASGQAGNDQENNKGGNRPPVVGVQESLVTSNGYDSNMAGNNNPNKGNQKPQNPQPDAGIGNPTGNNQDKGKNRNKNNNNGQEVVPVGDDETNSGISGIGGGKQQQAANKGKNGKKGKAQDILLPGNDGNLVNNDMLGQIEEAKYKKKQGGKNGKNNNGKKGKKGKKNWTKNDSPPTQETTHEELVNFGELFFELGEGSVREACNKFDNLNRMTRNISMDLFQECMLQLEAAQEKVRTKINNETACDAPEILLHSVWDGPLTKTAKLGIISSMYAHGPGCAELMLHTSNENPEKLENQLKPWFGQYVSVRKVDATGMMGLIVQHYPDLEDTIKQKANLIQSFDTRGNLEVTAYSDLIRILATAAYGGVYLDNDVLVLNSLVPLVKENKSFWYRLSYSSTCNNAAMGFVKGNPASKQLIQNILQAKNIKKAAQECNCEAMSPSVGNLMEMLPSTYFDPSLVMVEKNLQNVMEYAGAHYGVQSTGMDFFDTKEVPKAFEEFFPGAFGYHWHTHFKGGFGENSIADVFWKHFMDVRDSGVYQKGIDE